MIEDGYRLETLASSPNGMVPNSRLPVLIHRNAVTADQDTDLASAIEASFRRHNWLNNWRYPGIYDYYHFHSTSHEVLGVAHGQMKLRLFGEGGSDVDLVAGDILVMPAGVSHIYLDGSSDILVVGGYPDGRDWDLMRDEHVSEAERRDAIKRIMTLPIPNRDPVTGEAMQQWQQAPSSVEWGQPREELDPV
jgi:uncharacterized protein YjlB